MLDVKILGENNFQEIVVTGEVDASSSIILDNALGDCIMAGKNVVVNLTSLEYISSAGLGVFISNLDEIKNKKLELVLFGLNAKVLEVFEILGLAAIMKIVQTKEDAISLLR